MPKTISFALTTNQVRRRIKTVTRRLRWRKLKPGTTLIGCVKCMGLKLGETVERIATIQVESVDQEPLIALYQEPYGSQEAAKEGFPGMAGYEFARMFVRHSGCTLTEPITRIEFSYLD